ncbi:MAG: dTDP-Rha--alpha-D-GlcNAc-pyrophosphate polyprenol alpha-3-L-rhamnosyltransferase [Cytophagia bacterium]|nr:dTDP-Rha--alpha-D-GlcNAc-pyrophosphate polyprenol alpha-3-L-rhamnosyltransferase [Cytophagia bacterium]
MIKSTKKIAIVVINYNGKNLLKKFLPSLVKYSDIKISDIFIVDNNSDDGSVDFIKKNYSSVKIIQNDKNYGYAKGYNVGLNKIQSQYLVLINNDVEVSENWLDPMFNSMEQNKKIGSCQPKILSYKNRTTFEYAGAAGGYLDYLGYPYCRGRIFDTVELDKGQYDSPKEIFWSSGACMMVRNKLFKKLEGFDESFYAHMEEIDLCWRIKGLGFKNFCFPKSIVYHLGGGTLNYNSPKKTYLNFRNNLIMITKNESLISLTLKLPFRLFLDILASIYILIKNKSLLHFLEIIKAYVSFIIKLPHILFKKEKTKMNSNKLNKSIIPFEYYLRGKKRFSDL